MNSSLTLASGDCCNSKQHFANTSDTHDCRALRCSMIDELFILPAGHGCREQAKALSCRRLMAGSQRDTASAFAGCGHRLRPAGLLCSSRLSVGMDAEGHAVEPQCGADCISQNLAHLASAPLDTCRLSATGIVGLWLGCKMWQRQRCAAFSLDDRMDISAFELAECQQCLEVCFKMTSSQIKYFQRYWLGHPFFATMHCALPSPYFRLCRMKLILYSSACCRTS